MRGWGYVRLSVIEILWLGLVVVACGWFALKHGQDASWDFRNYHWYIPFAFLNGRMSFDVLPAEEATYYNPLLYVPYYWIATHLSARLAVFFVGALGGLNIIPLHLLGRIAAAPAHRRWLAPVLGLAGVTGATALSLLGSTQYDNALCVLALLGLALLVGARSALRLGGSPAWWIAGIAGFVVGCAVGLKLSFVIYAVGLVAALLAVKGAPRAHFERLVACGIGGALGVLLVSGFWFAKIYALTGNPFFPLFNSIFGSPLVEAGTFTEAEFVPRDLGRALAFPFLFTADYGVAGYDAFDGSRVLVVYVLLIVVCVLWALRRISRKPLVSHEPTRMLFAFAGGTYLSWLLLLGQYRYIVGLEILAPLLIWAAVGLLPLSQRWRMGIVAVLLVGTALEEKTYDWNEKVPLSKPYVKVDLPALPHPEKTMILTAGTKEPTAYLIPSLPPGIPVLRIAGEVGDNASKGTLWTMIAERMRAHQGDLYLLISDEDRAKGRKAAAQYGLLMDEVGCASFSSNLGGPYELCPLRRG